MRVVVDRLTSAQVTLTSQHARQLRTALHQSGGGGDTTTQLRDIVRQRMNDDTSFDVADLVLSLMMTPQLGKYVALLLPHCECIYIHYSYARTCIYTHVCTCTCTCIRTLI